MSPLVFDQAFWVVIMIDQIMDEILPYPFLGGENNMLLPNNIKYSNVISLPSDIAIKGR